MADEILFRRGTTVVRRQRLAPGEDTGWHRDPYFRVTVVLSGDELAIELPNGDVAGRIAVQPGQVDWEQPFDHVHRGVNVGREAYEEVAVFFLDDEQAEPQPRASVVVADAVAAKADAGA